MSWTNYDEVNHILEILHSGHLKIFGEKLKGFYLYGSLIWGDFDIVSSDIDTLCVLKTEITPDEIELLRIMHSKIITEYPAWKERIEVRYNSIDGLKNFRKFSSKMGNISSIENVSLKEFLALTGLRFVTGLSFTFYSKAKSLYFPI